MLKGRILKIHWDGSWHVHLGRVRKSFENYPLLYRWLGDILGKVKDPEKKKLLEWDIRWLGIEDGIEDDELR